MRHIKLLIIFPVILLSCTNSLAETLPSHIEIIRPPSAIDVHFAQGVVTLGQRMVVTGTYYGSETCPVTSIGHCPAMYIYERPGDEWELVKAVRSTEKGLAAASFVDSDTILYLRTFPDIGSLIFRLVVYRRNPETQEWEPSIPFDGSGVESFTMYQDTIVILGKGTIRFYEISDDAWIETDRLYVGSVHSFVDLPTPLSARSIRDDVLYIGVDQSMVAVDLGTREFVDYFEFPIVSTDFDFIGDTLITKQRAVSTASTYTPMILYESTGNGWVQTGQIDSQRDWRHGPGNVVTDETTVFADRATLINHDVAGPVSYFRETQAGIWEEAGTIIIQDGTQILGYLSQLNVVDNGALLAQRHNSTHNGRIFYIPDIDYYLDIDLDILPAGWEEKYGFSPVVFDDFTLDTDSDGLSDIEEFIYYTSPVLDDTDNDGMPDGWEVEYSLDPFDPADAALDPDQDGIISRQEYLDGTSPIDPSSRRRDPEPPPPEPSSGGGTSNAPFLFFVFLMARLLRKAKHAIRT